MTENDHAVKEIVLRDLQSLLRQSFGDGVIVEKYSTKNLLPIGENYGSTMFKVDAVIRRNEHSDTEDLQGVAKMLPPTEFQRIAFNSPNSFRKEIFMYEKILPAYNRLEAEFGVKENEAFNVLPKLYGSRLSLSSENDFDEDAVILMENLKVKGYSCGDRKVGYDLDHCRAAVKALARFHALGIAMKFKKPEIFQEIRCRSECMEYNEEMFDDSKKVFQAKFESLPEITQYFPRFEKSLFLDMDAWLAVPPEPWGTITHNDFWVNNVMFHHDETGKPDEIKFVDFQNYIFTSPMRELVFFLFSSGDRNIRQSCIDDLISLYYETLLSHLTKLQCDVSGFSRTEFDQRLREDASASLSQLMFMLKVITIDVEVDGGATDMEYLMTYEGNDAYNQRLVELIESYVERGWM